MFGDKLNECNIFTGVPLTGTMIQYGVVFDETYEPLYTQPMASYRAYAIADEDHFLGSGLLKTFHIYVETAQNTNGTFELCIWSKGTNSLTLEYSQEEAVPKTKGKHSVS